MSSEEVSLHESFILASGSEIRKQILSDHGLNFIVQTSEIDEEELKEKYKDLPFEQRAKKLALAKAEKVSEALEKLSKDKQVICITHLPQIASKADHHIYISKEIGNEKTVVSARYLSEDEKVHAIAELFSGEIIPSEGLNTAKQFRTQARG